MVSDNSKLHPGLKVLVLGLAKSGEAVAKLLIRHGVAVVVNERHVREKVEEAVHELEELGVECICGNHPTELLDRHFDFIVKNPGIPYTLPILIDAAARKIPIYTEIEVASWITVAPIYAITGSNGKTTTTTLVGEILSSEGKSPVVAGNIGTVLSGVVEKVDEKRPIVLEVSSFQLMGTKEFHPRIAAMLNLYQAHLDYHGSMEAYADAKWSMFQNMNKADFAVLNYDQSSIREKANQLAANVVWFSTKNPEIPEGVFIKDEQIVVMRNGIQTSIMNREMIALKGAHNLENALAAAAISIWAGTSVHKVREVLSEFRGVEHRTEYVRTIHEVDYYNDSKATNAQAALGALRGFSGQIVWIAGGLDRGVDFQNMKDDIRSHVKAAVLLGQSADKLELVCKEAQVQTIQHANSIEEAVQKAHDIAEAGDTVLLSPACASWDMFHSFEERGCMFKDAVHKL